MAKKKAAKEERTQNLPAQNLPAKEHAGAVYRMQSLLHTMRCIAQHEDRLCVLMNEIKSTGVVEPKIAQEIDRLLDELPSHEYTHDLEAVREALEPALAQLP